MKQQLAALAATFCLLTACGREEPAPAAPQDALTEMVFAMDTEMTLKVHTDDQSIMDDALDLIHDLESRLSTTREGSEIYTLNQEGAVTLSPDLAGLMDRALTMGRDTGGALDISIYPVVRAWGFTTGSYQVPDQATLDGLLAQVDLERIVFDPATGETSIPAGMQVDLGAVGKGYTGDRLAQLLRERGVTSALLNLGGNVHTVGTKPDGSPWRVAVQDPLSEDYMCVLDVADEAVITSGGYERYFEDEAGNVYWHIIDPDTGWPAHNGVISATAVGPEGSRCDALSTALFVMGPQRAQEYWLAHQDFEMILVTEAGELLVTEGLKDRITLAEGLSYTPSVIPAG